MRPVRLLVLLAGLLGTAPQLPAGCPCGSAAPPYAAKAAAEIASVDDVLRLLAGRAPEADVLAAVRRSPARFTLSPAQIDELRRAGATEAVVAALRDLSARPAGDVTDIALVIDCSGSMADRTPEGPTKMEAARRYAADFVKAVPAGRRVALVVFGHDKDKLCDAVRVARPLAALDDAGRADLVRTIEGLQPGGNTPLARAIAAARRELEGKAGPAAVVIVSDGVDTCDGRPADEAAALAGVLTLRRGIDVIGVGVRPDERKALEEIAGRSKGTYHDAKSAAELGKVFEAVRGATVGAGVPAGITVGDGLSVGNWMTARRLTNFVENGAPGVWRAKLSADGSRVVMATNKGTFTLPTARAAAGPPVRVGGAFVYPERIAVSADGKTVAWAEPEGTFVASADGTNRRKMPGSIAAEALWLTAAGDRVFVVSGPGGGVYAFPADGSDVTRLAGTADVAKLAGVAPSAALWNPGGAGRIGATDDGRRVVFRFGDNAFAVNADATGLAALTALGPATKGKVTSVAVSGDGRTVATYVLGGDVPEALHVARAGAAPVVYPRVGLAVEHLQVSRDGTEVAVCADFGGGLKVYAADGSGWRAPLDFGLNLTALFAPRGIHLTADFGKAVVANDVYVNQDPRPQLSLLEFRPAALAGGPTLDGLTVSPRSVVTDGSVPTEVRATVGGSDVRAAVVVIRTGRHARLSDLTALARAGDTPAFGTTQLRLRSATPVAPGPVTLRVALTDAAGNVLVADADGLAARAP